jgi:hypothetical protein
MMRRVCAWCRRDLGVVACRPTNVGLVSHGICEACSERWLNEPDGAEELTLGEAKEHLARVVADFPFRARPTLNGAAAAPAVPTPTGIAPPPQVNGTATPDANAPAVMDNPSGGPAASFITPLKEERPSRSFVEFIDWLIKCAVTGRKIR